MAEPVKQASGSKSAGSEVEWAALAPKIVDRECAMSAVEVAKVWHDMMSRARLRSPSEQQQRAFRVAVYVYALLNGTSRAGSYSGKITTADGFEFEAAVIPKATGKYRIRKFFRGNANESYFALKAQDMAKLAPDFVAEKAKLGISAEHAFATADWLGKCAEFTIAEEEAHQRSFDYGVERAKRARGGHTLESVEGTHVREQLMVQGSMEPRAPAYRHDENVF